MRYFQAKRTTLTFLTQIFQKIGLGLEIQKNNVGIRISILEIRCIPIFRQNRQILLFRPKFAQKLMLGKLPNYVQYFGSNNVEGAAESRVEAEIRWMEVGALFTNTHFSNLKKK